MLNGGKKTQSRDGRTFAYPVAPNAVIYQGALVALAAGLARPAGPGAGLVVVGVAKHAAPSIWSPAGKVEVETGVYLFENSAGADAITAASIGQVAYAVDDETVALTSANTARPAAGIIVDVESDGVWVCIGVTQGA